MQQSDFSPQPSHSPNQSPQPHLQQMVSGQATDSKYCADCGQVIALRAEICPKCGVRQLATTSSQSNGTSGNSGRNRTTAAVLAFFLGGVGAHRFYYGQVGLGFLYLIFCWTFIPGIIAFVEGILLLLMSDEDFDAKFNAT